MEMAFNAKMSVTVVQLLFLIEEVIQGGIHFGGEGWHRGPSPKSLLLPIAGRPLPRFYLNDLLEHLVWAPYSHYLNRHFK